jgi:hypothetical protein
MKEKRSNEMERCGVSALQMSGSRVEQQILGDGVVSGELYHLQCAQCPHGGILGR